MKKLLLVCLLTASLAFGLTACSNSSGLKDDGGSSADISLELDQGNSSADTSDTSQSEEQNGGTMQDEEQSGESGGTTQDEEQSGESSGASQDEEQSGESGGTTQDEEQSGESSGTAEISQDSAQDYAVSAISAVNIITAMNVNSSSASAVSLLSAMNSAGSKNLLAATVTDSEKLSSLDEYMAIVNGILSESSYGVTNTASDRAEYTVKSTLSFADMSGVTVEYTMYYNETNVREYTKTDDGKAETERRADIQGILIIDGVEYAINGVNESETDGTETEYETTFTVMLSSSGYIVIKHESSEDIGESEVEYEFYQYENGKLIKRTTFSYEQEQDETEIELSVTENGTTTKFYFEKETEYGTEYITIKIGSAGSTEKYRVYVTQNADGTYGYTYEKISR